MANITITEIRDKHTEGIISSKTKSTYYNAEKVAAARENIEKYEWAKVTRDDAVEEANKYVEAAELLWNIVTPQSIPRGIIVNSTYSCPNCGKDLRVKYSNYPWVIDPVNDPWIVKCPDCGIRFPSNDFGAYYESGINRSGIFESALADKSLLVNTLYPEKGEKWGVDDGYGYKDINGNMNTFIAYYNHWGLWYSNGIIKKALNALRDAYIYTGDAKYARTGTILLDRIADVYPDMSLDPYSSFLNSHGGTGKGKIIGSIWETALVQSFITAYDAFFPAIEDQELISFLVSKSKQYYLDNPKNTAALISKNIEDKILREVYPAVKNIEIRGNFGMHQAALALAAVVLDSNPETPEWLDFTFQTGSFLSEPNHITGGEVITTLVDKVDRDGHGNEAAPGYNNLWLSQLKQVADALDGYEGYPGADLYKNPKFMKMFSAMYPLMLCECYTAQIGDSGGTGNTGLLLSIADAVDGFIKFGDPILAQMAHFLNNNSAEGLHAGIFTRDPEKVSADILRIINEKGKLNLCSDNLTGYGFSVLRDGENYKSLFDNQISFQNNQRDFWLYYGRTNTSHAHRDQLNLGLHAYGLDFAPDLGYPEETGAQPNRVEWVSNTVSHNTVVVDAAKQEETYDGTPLHFDDSRMVKLVDVDSNKAYTQTEMYRRTIAMVKVDDEISYGVDFFRVKGGNDHYYSFHGAEGAVTTEGLNLSAQITGTYEGIDMDFGQRADNASSLRYTGSGFHWLKNVKKDENPDAAFSVDWDIIDGRGILKEPVDIHLRLTMLGEVDDVAIMDGQPPKTPGNPKWLKYMIAHRKGENLSSLFTSVIEPYKDSRYIQAISEVPVSVNSHMVIEDVKAIKVFLNTGRIDYIVNALDNSIVYTIDDKFQFRGFLGVYSEKNGKQIYGYVNDGDQIGKTFKAVTSRITGTVKSFTKEISASNELTIELAETNVDVNKLDGQYIYIINDGTQNAVYKILGIKAQNRKQVTFDLGDSTLIRKYLDSSDLSKGFEFNIAEGNAFSIPLSYEIFCKTEF